MVFQGILRSPIVLEPARVVVPVYDYDDDDYHHYHGGYFCPPGQAKKGRC